MDLVIYYSLSTWICGSSCSDFGAFCANFDGVRRALQGSKHPASAGVVPGPEILPDWTGRDGYTR